MSGTSLRLLLPLLLPCLAACGGPTAAETDPEEEAATGGFTFEDVTEQEPDEDDPYRIPFEDEDDGGEAFDQVMLDERIAAITPRVAELRRLPWRHGVPGGIHTPAQFTEFAKVAFEEEFEPGQLEAYGQVYGLLGMLPMGMDFEQTLTEMLESMVGGYYDPETSTFYMISTFNQGAMADYIMAHELGHALDDQHYPLIPFMEAAKGNADREWATTCVVEGSASAVGNMYMVQGAMEGWFDASTMDLGSMMGMLDQLNDIPPILIISMTLPYTIGNAFLVRQTSALAGMVKEPTEADLERVFDNPPVSSEQILHPEKYWDPEQLDLPEDVFNPDRSAILGEGWASKDSNVIGELGCAVMVMKRVPSAIEVSAGGGTWVQEASAGWDGDRYRLYRNAAGDTLLEWRTLWDTAKDAQEFEQALSDVVAARVSTLQGFSLNDREVVAVFASEGAPAEAQAALRKAALGQ